MPDNATPLPPPPVDSIFATNLVASAQGQSIKFNNHSFDQIPSRQGEVVDFQQIIADNKYPDPGLTPDEQTAFSHRYSFAALIWQFVYYFAMGDTLMAWLSIICSVVFILAPLLLIFPIWARRRAYQSKNWSGFSEFYHAQKKWDRSALYLLIVSVILLLITFWLLGPILLNAIQAVTGSTDANSNFSQQVQDTVKQYQDVLGQ